MKEVSNKLSFAQMEEKRKKAEGEKIARAKRKEEPKLACKGKYSKKCIKELGL